MKTDLLHVSARAIRFRKDMKKNTKATSLKVYEPIAPNFGLYRKRPQRVSTLKRMRELREVKNLAEEKQLNDETKTYEDSYGRYSIYKCYFVEIGQWRYIKRYVVDFNRRYDYLSLNQQCLTAAFKINYNSSKYLAFFTEHGHGTTEQFNNLLVHFCENVRSVCSNAPFWKTFWETPYRRNLWLPSNFQ